MSSFTSYSYNSVWNKILDECEKIECDLNYVSTLIVTSRQKDSYMIEATKKIKGYHTIYCRAFILLYYCHKDEEKYQLGVFNQLREEMGAFGEDEFFNLIISSINNLLEIQKKIAAIDARTEIVTEDTQNHETTDIETVQEDCCEEQDTENDLPEVKKLSLRTRIEALLNIFKINNQFEVSNKRGLARYIAAILNENSNTVYTTMYRKDKKTGTPFKLNAKQHGEDVKYYNDLIDQTKLNLPDYYKLIIPDDN